MSVVIWMPFVVAEPNVWEAAFRIIPSRYPPINLFENVIDPEYFDIAMAIESLTNPRLRDEIGEINAVPKEDRVFGANASVVMASFTHFSPDRPSRFSDGSFGIYYCANSVETAVAETKYHMLNFYAATNEAPNDFHFRCYQNQLALPMIDVRVGHDELHDPNDYSRPQAFAKQQKIANENGILFRSVRHAGGECAAGLRPRAVTLPIQSCHLIYHWNGRNIDSVLRVDGSRL